MLLVFQVDEVFVRRSDDDDDDNFDDDDVDDDETKLYEWRPSFWHLSLLLDVPRFFGTVVQHQDTFLSKVMPAICSIRVHLYSAISTASETSLWWKFCVLVVGLKLKIYSALFKLVSMFTCAPFSGICLEVVWCRTVLTWLKTLKKKKTIKNWKWRIKRFELHN